MSAKGYVVATAKSSKHELENKRGTDTARHRKAGAVATVFIGGSVGTDQNKRMKALVKALGSLNPDYLIVEGMKSSPIPKIWCVGDTGHNARLPPETRAVVTWNEPSSDAVDVPVFQSDDIGNILSTVVFEAVELSELMDNLE